MMSKLTDQGNNQNKQFKSKIYQGTWRGQSRKVLSLSLIIKLKYLLIDTGIVVVL